MDNITSDQRTAPPAEHALHQWIADAYNKWVGPCSQSSGQKGTEFANGVCEFAKTAALYVPGPGGRAASAVLYAADEINLRDSKNVAYDIACGALKGSALRLINDAGVSSATHPLIQGALLGVTSRISDVAFTRSTYQRPGHEGFDAWYGLQNVSTELTNRQAFVMDIATFSAASALAKFSPLGRDRLCSHMGATISGAAFGFVGGAVQEAGSQRMQGDAINWAAVARSGMAHAVLDGSAASLGHGLGCSAGGQFFARRFDGCKIQPTTTGDGTMLPTAARRPGNGSKLGTLPFTVELRPDARLSNPSGGTALVNDNSYHIQQRQLLSKFGDNLDGRQSDELFAALAGIDKRNFTGELHQDTVKQIYQQTERLLDPEALIPQVRGAGPLLAKQLLMQVANPHLVQQGNHPTCTVAALEHRLFKKDPEKATDVIVQAATSAAYTPPYAYNGKELTVRLDPQSMIAEHTCIDPYGEGGMHRSYASHILQYVAPNIHWQAKDANLRYERATKAREFTIRDFGKQRPALVHDYPHLGPSETTSIYEAITGNGMRCHYSGDSFRSQRDFKEKLVDAKQQQQLPLIMSVDVRHSPFYDLVGESTRLALSETDHTHDICVTDFNPKNGMVSVYNSWGRQFHPSGIPLDTLYKALERSR